MFEFIKDHWQDERIRDNQSDISDARFATEDLAHQNRQQQRQIDHLTLLCQSVWELLRETTGMTDVQLRNKVAAVDNRDGKADGKISERTFPCPRCGKQCNSKNETCPMCGIDLRLHKPNIFEG